MRFGFDEINYKKIYFRYIWISYVLMLLIIVLIKFIFTFFSIPTFLYGLFALLLGVTFFLAIFGVPFVIYRSFKIAFKSSYINIENAYLHFDKICNVASDPSYELTEKHKVSYFFNITSITETHFCYKINGEVDFFYIYPYRSTPSNLKHHHKTGTFRLPKCFGEENEFRESLYNLKDCKRISIEDINTNI